MIRQPLLSRRQTVAWMLAAASSPLALSACGERPKAPVWPDLKLSPITAAGYGGDPDLIDPSAPWPLTLAEAQRNVVRIAADIILPADDVSPSAGALPVDAFVDEWVSAPYPAQQEDRPLIVSGLAWLDAEARARFRMDFVAASDAGRREIFDDIAFKERVKEGYEKPAAFLGRLRWLVLAGFYTLPEGVADLGYIGDKPFKGLYPGPTQEALDHLRAVLEKLNLPFPSL